MKFIKGGKCMKKGYLKRSFAFCLILAMMLMLGIVSFADDAAPAMTPGTYTGTAKSVGGPLSVEVEVTTQKASVQLRQNCFRTESWKLSPPILTVSAVRPSLPFFCAMQ
jgi:hypothetical protein